MASKAVAATSLVALVLSGCGGAGDSQKGSGIFTQTSVSVSRSCEGGGIATGDEVAVTGDIDLRAAPSGSAKRVINERATEILHETYYHSVDQTERLKELCRQKNWSKVQVVEPASLNYVMGWVPVSALRSIERDASGTRNYVESDFTWDAETASYKAALVANVNKIVRENERCESVDPGTLSRSGNKGTRGKPVFFITCNTGADVFNVWFEPGDAAAGKTFRAVQNIGQGAAVIACERAAREAANNPQTVDFSQFLDVAFVPYPNGNSRLVSSFTAKNSFGVEGKFNIECFFEGDALTERHISETIT